MTEEFFQDFCTVCDKQCPCGSVYCSEECRLKEYMDANSDAVSQISSPVLSMDYNSDSDILSPAYVAASSPFHKPSTSSQLEEELTGESSNNNHNSVSGGSSAKCSCAHTTGELNLDARCHIHTAQHRHVPRSMSIQSPMMDLDALVNEHGMNPNLNVLSTTNVSDLLNSNYNYRKWMSIVL